MQETVCLVVTALGVLQVENWNADRHVPYLIKLVDGCLLPWNSVDFSILPSIWCNHIYLDLLLYNLDGILTLNYFCLFNIIFWFQVNYGNFMHGLMKENIQLNRKVLSELSMHEPYSFKALVDISRNAFPGNKNIVHPPRKADISINA